VEVREPIELAFGVVSGVGGGTGALDRSPRVPRGKGSLGFCHLHFFEGMNRRFQAKCTKYSNVHVMETTAWVLSKFFVTVKTIKYASWVI